MSCSLKPSFIFKLHSVSDLITNSSSEVFIINTNKTISAFMDALVEAVEARNVELSEVLFTEKFNTPSIIDVDLCVNSYLVFLEFYNSLDNGINSNSTTYNTLRRVVNGFSTVNDHYDYFEFTGQFMKPWNDMIRENLKEVASDIIKANNMNDYEFTPLLDFLHEHYSVGLSEKPFTIDSPKLKSIRSTISNYCDTSPPEKGSLVLEAKGYYIEDEIVEAISSSFTVAKQFRF